MASPLVAELQRRRVFRATVAYGVAAFAVLQIAEPIMHALHWPDRVLTWIVLGIAAGFPLAVALAWIFDLRAGRVERTRSEGGPGFPQVALAVATIGVLAAAPGLVWYFGFHQRPQEAPPPPPSIAVLPFVDLSAQKDQEYFSDGLAEELLSLMSKVPGLQVAARTSSFAFKGKSEDVAAIAQKLHVATVLEGSVRKAGDRIRISTQLINAQDGYHLWSETFDRQLTDVFAVQDEIARAVVRALQLRLLHGLPDARRTRVPEAYNEYLVAKDFFHRNNVDGFGRARKAYQRAVDLDPGYAPAWAGLATASYWVADAAGSLRAVLAGQDQALQAAERAIALAPDLSEGYAARGFLLSAVRHDFAASRADFDRALALDPENAETLADYANATLRPLGALPEAVAMLRKAVERDPLNARTWSALGASLSVYARPGEFGPAREAMNRSLEISPEQSYTPLHLAVTYLREGKPAEALAISRRSTSDLFRLQGVALAEHELGHDAAARKALEEMIGRLSFAAAYQIAAVYASWGDKDHAVEWLGRAIDQRDGGAALAKVDPLMKNLHGDPRYATLLRRLNLPPD